MLFHEIDTLIVHELIKFFPSQFYLEIFLINRRYKLMFLTKYECTSHSLMCILNLHKKKDDDCRNNVYDCLILNIINLHGRIFIFSEFVPYFWKVTFAFQKGRNLRLNKRMVTISKKWKPKVKTACILVFAFFSLHYVR